jgi:hypothetical protein
MPATDVSSEVYQFRVWLRGISPAIWRRIQLRSDQTLADLHYSLQIVYGWSDEHLHRFVIRARHYGLYQPGGPWFTQFADHVPLRDLHLRLKERFLYEYDFTDGWQHELRLEARLPAAPGKIYPFCTGGARVGPLEDCGGPWAFMARQAHFTPWRIHLRLLELLTEPPEDRELLQAEVEELRYWLTVDRFDRRAVNRQLQRYASGADDWYFPEEEGSDAHQSAGRD